MNSLRLSRDSQLFKTAIINKIENPLKEKVSKFLNGTRLGNRRLFSNSTCMELDTQKETGTTATQRAYLAAYILNKITTFNITLLQSTQLPDLVYQPNRNQRNKIQAANSFEGSPLSSHAELLNLIKHLTKTQTDGIHANPTLRSVQRCVRLAQKRNYPMD